MNIRGGERGNKVEKEHPEITQKEEGKDYSQGFGEKAVSSTNSSFLFFVLQAYTHPLCFNLYNQH